MWPRTARACYVPDDADRDALREFHVGRDWPFLPLLADDPNVGSQDIVLPHHAQLDGGTGFVVPLRASAATLPAQRALQPDARPHGRVLRLGGAHVRLPA